MLAITRARSTKPGSVRPSRISRWFCTRTPLTAIRPILALICAPPVDGRRTWQPTCQTRSSAATRTCRPPRSSASVLGGAHSPARRRTPGSARRLLDWWRRAHRSDVGARICGARVGSGRRRDGGNPPPPPSEERKMPRLMDTLAELVGKSTGIEAVRERIQRMLGAHPTPGRFPPILIEGEPGTGKGLGARLIHRAGPRAAGPFVEVNCAAIPETLLESELFGFERGAFTDAKRTKPGLFQSARGGSIFLDEVGLLSEALQAKLLTAIEQRRVRALGRTQSEDLDLWVIAATNEDLAQAVRTRRF